MASVDPNPSDVEIAQQLLELQAQIRNVKADSYTRTHLIAGAMDRSVDPAWQGKTQDEVERVSNSAPNRLGGAVQAIGSYAVNAFLIAQWLTVGPEAAGTIQGIEFAVGGSYGILSSVVTTYFAANLVTRRRDARAAKLELQARVERFETEYPATQSAELDAKIELARLETESANLQLGLARRLGMPNDWRVIERAQTIAGSATETETARSIETSLSRESASGPDASQSTIRESPSAPLTFGPS